ncbi:F0F1 ATP synthase subunit gamma [[Phormidium ambiguum] IAM M-71]|uniref:F0F1 ATP synthase subunit gamma n=1 Tax=[Phormidium ambiguum] IAM M-71 TaxID=454136 RepID=A0A1U7IRP4_9CYAN|nr:F0F1 ATP synthase subunit gamma [Phormidium ambiguum]OKH40042.1 F0F1 ATP synthase subunit gamma [Phormidium ambiguum IAM M-71]
MPSLEALKQQIESTQDLRSVVKTMKTLAAASIRQYERAVESLANYNRTIEMGLQVLLQEQSMLNELPVSFNQRLGAIVFGTDQGLCGSFNEQIAKYAIEQLNQVSERSSERSIITMGSRVIPPLETAGLEIAQSFSMPTTLAGITAMVQVLLLQIEAWRSQQQIERVLLFYQQPHSNTAHAPCTVNLLPIDRQWLENLRKQTWSTRVLPIFTMEWSHLFAELIRHYLFVSLYRAFAESLASENASRLISMQVAEQNIEERLEAFNAAFQQQRQSIITEEILEILSGFEVLTQSDSRTIFQ